MNTHHGRNIKVFAANSNVELAKEITKYLGVPLGNARVTKFSDGEISMNIYETVRGSDVFVIQSTCSPVNTHLMELLIMIDAFKRASAAQITAVIPYYGYSRQDRKVKARDPITAKLVADLLTTAGAHRVLTMDLHAGQIQGFFNIPVDNLYSMPLFAREYIDRGFTGDETVVVAPDLGSVTRARNFAHKLNAPLAIIDKRRPRVNVAEAMNIIGDVKGKRAILIDDMIDTAGTIQQGAKALIERGQAREVYACATHAVLSGPAIERIKDSPVKEIMVTNTIPLPPEKQIDKIRVISVAALFAEAIERIYEGLPVSILFD
jgi:ribose-phosphate pyrophosphokinase